MFVLLSALLMSCSDVNEAPISSNENTLNKQNNWLTLPAPDDPTFLKIFTVSRIINGTNGGSLTINSSYTGTTGKVTVYALLSFPPKIWYGKKTVTMTLDDAIGHTDFLPEGEFLNGLYATYNLKITGMSLTSLILASLQFVYLAPDGTVQTVRCDGIYADLLTGTLAVKNARLFHFSRYGFIN
jgi:hypothetical protein